MTPAVFLSTFLSFLNVFSPETLLLNLHLFLTWLLCKSITFIVKSLSALQQVLNSECCQQSVRAQRTVGQLVAFMNGCFACGIGADLRSASSGHARFMDCTRRTCDVLLAPSYAGLKQLAPVFRRAYDQNTQSPRA